MVSPEAAELGSRLDQDHSPETNTRMAVCRRCGARTDGPEGHQHLPDERQLARFNRWLDAEGRAKRVSRARGLSNS